MDAFLNDLGYDLIKSASGTLIGLLIGWFVWKWLERRFYGGWSVKVITTTNREFIRKVSSRKAKMVLDDDSDRAVYLKGVASPYGLLNLDPVSDEAKSCGLIHEDRIARVWIIDLRKNPPDHR